METPPLRTFLVIGSFVGLFAILITAGVASCPDLFMDTQKQYREQSVVEYFETIDLLSFVDYKNFSLDETGGQSVGKWYHLSFKIGSRDIRFRYIKHDQSNKELYTLYPTNVLFWQTWHEHRWYNYEGQDQGHHLNIEELESDIDNLEYTAKTDGAPHYEMFVEFDFDRTTYSNVEEAWSNKDLWVFIGIDWDDMKTGLNAFDLIAMILFFQMPDIHPVLNFILALPLWISIAWLSVAFIIAFIRALPFT